MKKPVLYLKSFTSNPNFLSVYPDMDDINDPCVLDTYKVQEVKQKKQEDAYKPKTTRGIGTTKEGYCETCKKWFRLKNSSYWYHMNYIHGINSKGVKYPVPEYRIVHGRLYGYCTACDEWIFLGCKVNDKGCKFGWYRHCQKTHTGNKTM